MDGWVERRGEYVLLLDREGGAGMVDEGGGGGGDGRLMEDPYIVTRREDEYNMCTDS